MTSASVPWLCPGSGSRGGLCALAVPSGRSWALGMGQVCPPKVRDQAEEGVQTLRPREGRMGPVLSTARAEWPVWAAHTVLLPDTPEFSSERVTGKRHCQLGRRGSCRARKAPPSGRGGRLATDPLSSPPPNGGPGVHYSTLQVLRERAAAANAPGLWSHCRPQPLEAQARDRSGQDTPPLSLSGSYTFWNVLSSVKEQAYELPWRGRLCDPRWGLGPTLR